MVKIAIVTGTTRPGTKAPAVADWILAQSSSQRHAEFDILDIAAFDLPLLDEPIPPMRGQYTRNHTKAWSEAVAKYDGFIFVTPEYNHGPAPALVNAIDYLAAEWTDKAAAFVSYGAQAGGVRAVEPLRSMLAALNVATIANHVNLSLLTDFVGFSSPNPAETKVQELDALFRQLTRWAKALGGIRSSI